MPNILVFGLNGKAAELPDAPPGRASVLRFVDPEFEMYLTDALISFFNQKGYEGVGFKNVDQQSAEMLLEYGFVISDDKTAILAPKTLAAMVLIQEWENIDEADLEADDAQIVSFESDGHGGLEPIYELWSSRQPRDRYGRWSRYGGGFSNSPHNKRGVSAGGGIGFGSEGSRFAARTSFSRTKGTGITRETYTKGPFKERYTVSNFNVRLFGKPAPHTAFKFRNDGEFKSDINIHGRGTISTNSRWHRAKQTYSAGRFASRYRETNYTVSGRLFSYNQSDDV